MRGDQCLYGSSELDFENVFLTTSEHQSFLEGAAIPGLESLRAFPFYCPISKAPVSSQSPGGNNTPQMFRGSSSSTPQSSGFLGSI